MLLKLFAVPRFAYVSIFVKDTLLPMYVYICERYYCKLSMQYVLVYTYVCICMSAFGDSREEKSRSKLRKIFIGFHPRTKTDNVTVMESDRIDKNKVVIMEHRRVHVRAAGDVKFQHRRMFYHAVNLIGRIFRATMR